MKGQRLLQSIRLKNLLSFGSAGVSLDLEPLNVLIGPNASGKSNLIEAISLLAAAPKNLTKPFREGGGVTEWIWKGSDRVESAELEVSLEGCATPLGYKLAIGVLDFRPVILSELLESLSQPKRYLFQRDSRQVQVERTGSNGVDAIRWDTLDRDQSLLAQIRDPAFYPELTLVGDQLKQIAFFRDWHLGRGGHLRGPQPADLPNDFLMENAGNLGLVLNNLQNRPTTKKLLLDKLRLVYEGVEDFQVKVEGGTVQVFLHEAGFDTPVPATRLSDGTLHYLALLAILCHPDPPPLVCIEEPELGLHPDILPTIGDLLLEAVQRTQLIVTTHSETLVSRLSETPEAVVICERSDTGTSLQRLDRPGLEEWLERYSLGELWRMGEIGGNRW